MIKNIIFFILPYSLLLFSLNFQSCAESAEAEDVVIVNEVNLTIEDFIWDSETRTGASMSGTSVSYRFVEGDTVGVYPVGKGSQVEFPIANITGSTAHFDGGGWTMKKDQLYVAYYPYDFYNRKSDNIKLNYKNQVQTLGNELNDACLKDYIYAQGAAPIDGSISFKFVHIGSLLKLTMTVPEVNEYNKLVISVDEGEFPIVSKMDLTSGSPVLTPIDKSKSIEVELKGICSTETNKDVVLWIMFPIVDLTTSTINLDLYSVDNKVYSGTTNGRNFKEAAIGHRESILEYVGSPSGLNFTFESGEMTDGETIEIEGGTEEQ